MRNTPVETAVQILAVIQLATIGLSHVLAPRAWADLFILLRSKGHAGVFVVAFLSLWFGSVIVAFHNVWSGIPAVLTLLGWAQVLKALIYFTFPAYGLRALSTVSVERARVFVYAGLFLLALASLVGYHLGSAGAGG